MPQVVLFGLLGIAIVVAGVASGYAVKRRRERDRAQQERDRIQREFLASQNVFQTRLLKTQGQLVREMEKELQSAHDMQMGLMPTAPPRIEGFDIAGRCIPANHVGGDYFQYFEQDGTLSLCFADVTGDAMEAAIPVVMFSGILDNQIRYNDPMDVLFGELNRSLHRIFSDSRTFICFALGELDLSTRTLRVSNAGCPYPYHYRASTGELVEVSVSAGPLGVRPEMTCQVVDIQLASRDWIVFRSDGIIEAMDASGELFGYDRTEEMIRRACVEDLSAEEMIDRILGEVDAFRGDASQSDDMTLVVMKVL